MSPPAGAGGVVPDLRGADDGVGGQLHGGLEDGLPLHHGVRGGDPTAGGARQGGRGAVPRSRRLQDDPGASSLDQSQPLNRNIPHASTNRSPSIGICEAIRPATTKLLRVSYLGHHSAQIEVPFETANRATLLVRYSEFVRLLQTALLLCTCIVRARE
eukprot:8214659-Pyramimonas_sp.AAC.1